MNMLMRRSMRPEEFLAWEERQPEKWEFDGVRPVAMTGATAEHSAIQGNLITALNIRLRGKPCRPHGPDLKVKVGAAYRYPDGVVTCTPIPIGTGFAPEPVVIFEIISDSTERTDRTEKLLEYRSLPSMQRYVLLEQDRALATVFWRHGASWLVDQLQASETLAMPEIGIEIPIAEFYIDVTFPDGPEGSDVRPEER